MHLLLLAAILVAVILYGRRNLGQLDDLNAKLDQLDVDNQTLAQNITDQSAKIQALTTADDALKTAVANLASAAPPDLSTQIAAVTKAHDALTAAATAVAAGSATIATTAADVTSQAGALPQNPPMTATPTGP